MTTISRIIKGINNWLYDPEYKIGKIAIAHFRPEFIPDRLYLKYLFHYVFGYKLNLKTPKTFNEKLQWLKLYYRNPFLTTLVDKYAVKQWVASKIGNEYIIPTLSVYDSVDEIEFNKLPERFVLKCTHDSGSTCICRDKSSFDYFSAKQKLAKSLQKDFYLKYREWPYKNVKRRIIVEEYKENSTSSSLVDYKFFCFNGKVKALFVATDRQSQEEETKFDYFDENYYKLDIINGHPCSKVPPQKPISFEEMKNKAELLSCGIPHARIDFYDVDGHIYFGEITLFHWGGFMPFSPQSWDKTFGDWLVLPSKY